MKILNLYAGLGGNRSLWSRTHEITAVENDGSIVKLYKKRFPHDKVLFESVNEFLMKKDVNEFDFIWASPPCSTHSQMQKFNKKKMPIPRMDEIYGLIIWLEKNYEGKFAVENVQPWYKTPIQPTARIDRHIFWANFKIIKKRFREKRKMHGTLSKSHIMRDSKDKLIKDFMLEDIKHDLLKLARNERFIRNCVDPRIGAYILSQCIYQKDLFEHMTGNDA